MNEFYEAIRRPSDEDRRDTKSLWPPVVPFGSLNPNNHRAAEATYDTTLDPISPNFDIRSW